MIHQPPSRILVPADLSKPLPGQRRSSPLGYFGIAVLLGTLGLYAERTFHSTLLLRPAYKWTTREIPGGVLRAADGSYSLDFRSTRLDWRLVKAAGTAGGPEFELLGYPALRLTVWRRADPSPEYAIERGFLEELPVPGAHLGRMFLTEGHQIVGSFAIGTGFVVLRFESIPPPGERGMDFETLLTDIRGIAGSLRQPAILP